MMKMKALLASAALATLASGVATEANANANAYLFGYTYPPYQTGYVALIINGSTTVYADTTGWYDFTGMHSATNPDYIVGNCSISNCGGGAAYNDFFTFNLGGISAGSITSVTLSAWNPLSPPYLGYQGPPNTYTLYDVSTPIDTLNMSNSGAVAIYDDLGSGVSYGSVGVSTADNGTQVLVSFDLAGITAANLAAGGEFAIGGSLGVYNPAPEPSTWALMALGFAGLAFAGYRTSRKAAALPA